MNLDEAVDYAARLHALVDELTEPLRRRHAGRLACRAGCAGCCQDGLTVFAVEAELIRRRHGALLAGGLPHEAGACAFLDEAGRCRIYADRPYVCRTQGLPLRWAEEAAEGGAVERRDICPLNDGRDEAGGARFLPVELLAPEDCWTLGPVEARLRAVQVAASGGADRVALRALFARAADGE